MISYSCIIWLPNNHSLPSIHRKNITKDFIIIGTRPGRFWPDPQTRPEPARKFRVMNTIFQPKTRKYPNPKNPKKNGSGRVGYGSTQRVRPHAGLSEEKSAVGMLKLGLLTKASAFFRFQRFTVPVCKKWTGWSVNRVLPLPLRRLLEKHDTNFDRETLAFFFWASPSPLSITLCLCPPLSVSKSILLHQFLSIVISHHHLHLLLTVP